MRERYKEILAVFIALSLLALFLFNIEAVKDFLDIIIENVQIFFDVFRF